MGKFLLTVVVVVYLRQQSRINTVCNLYLMAVKWDEVEFAELFCGSNITCGSDITSSGEWMEAKGWRLNVGDCRRRIRSRKKKKRKKKDGQPVHMFARREEASVFKSE